jgi:hypothetical protein
MADYTDILTPQEIDTEALAASDAAQDEKVVVSRLIGDVQRRIESYISQPLTVHRHTQGVRRWDWVEDEVQSDVGNFAVAAWADHQPVVEVVNGDVSARFSGDRFVKDHRDDLKVEFFAGYVRQDVALADLPNSDGERLDGLTERPPTLPQDIRRVAVKLVLYELNQAEHRQGMGTTTAAIGGGDTITVEGPDPGFPERQLRQLDPYKRPTL